MTPEAARAEERDKRSKMVPLETREVFAALVDAHYRKLYIFALGLTHSEADAADLTQEAFRRWAAKGSHVSDPNKARSWLYQTLYRVFIDESRKRKRWATLPPDGSAEELVTSLSGRRSSDQKAAVEALARLPEKFRAPVTLYYLHDCSYLEIGNMLGLRLGTVMSRLSRGRRKLLEQLDGEKGASEDEN